MKKVISLFLIGILCFGVCTSTLAASKECSEWAQWSVNKAFEAGLLEVDKEYQYKDPITREEFCELVNNFLVKVNYYTNWYNEQTDNGTKPLAPFAKKPFDDTESVAVDNLYQHNIVYGKTADLFMPYDRLTREEAATIISRAIYAQGGLPATEMWYEFADVDEISSWAIDAVQQLCNLQIMVGVDGRLFAPKETITTEQAITAIVRLCIIAGVVERQEAPEVLTLTFRDKDGNIIITEDDLIGCEAQRLDFNGGTFDWCIELTLNDEGSRKFKEGTARVSKFSDGENYIVIAINESVISAPTVEAQIDSNIIIVSGGLSEESANEFANIIKRAVKE